MPNNKSHNIQIFFEEKKNIFSRILQFLVTQCNIGDVLKHKNITAN